MYKWTIGFVVVAIVALLGVNSLLTKATEAKKFSNESVLVNRLGKEDLWSVSVACANTPEKSLEIYNKATALAKTENIFNSSEEITLFAKAFTAVTNRPFPDEQESELIVVEFSNEEGTLLGALVLGFRGDCWLGSFRLTADAWTQMKENMRGI